MTDELTPTQRLYVSIFTSYLKPAVDELGDNPPVAALFLAIGEAQLKTDGTLDFCEHDRKAAVAFIRKSMVG